MQSLVELKCDVCGKSFSKRKSEHNRCLKRGLKRSFCSRVCCGKATIGNIPVDKRGGAEFVKPHCGNRRDKYSPFKPHLRCARRRGHEFDLTLEYLKDLWESQNGICPLTGWEMEHTPPYKKGTPITPRRASLDRIDSAKGYVKGNVQFVCFMAQMAKHVFTNDDVINFAESVVKWNSRA